MTIEFEEIEVTLPVIIRGVRHKVFDVFHARAKPRKHASDPDPVVYVDVYETTNTLMAQRVFAGAGAVPAGRTDGAA